MCFFIRRRERWQPFKSGKPLWRLVDGIRIFGLLLRSDVSLVVSLLADFEEVRLGDESRLMKG